MKYPVTRFKSLEVCLKELEPFIRNGEHLQTGKPFRRFDGLRSREILANWLLCVALNSEPEASPLTFSSDPLGGDGIITDGTKTWMTEHVLVPRATLTLGEHTMSFKGQPYLVHFVLPNFFYFHCTTAYDILRHCGVDLSKRDFIGTI
jgi:hypothetical protein